MYIYITNTDKDCDLLQDRPILPRQTVPQLSWLKPKSVRVLEGLNAKTDWLLQSDSYSLHHRVQTGSGAHPASYPVGIGGGAARAWSWPLDST
jgi:hypothetical protein